LIKLSTESIRYIALFEGLTGATARDCIVDEENSRIIFVVKNGDMGLAIGRNGENINRVKRSIGKQVEVIEYSEDLEEFLKNIIRPVLVRNISVSYRDDKRIAYVEVLSKDKGLAIGRSGKNVEKAKMLAQRHHGIDDVIIQ
jgi:N utilization substance protein A